jgi:hypothetical protein
MEELSPSSEENQNSGIISREDLIEEMDIVLTRISHTLEESERELAISEQEADEADFQILRDAGFYIPR